MKPWVPVGYLTPLCAWTSCFLILGCQTDENASRDAIRLPSVSQSNESCLVAKTSAFQVTRKDVSRLRMTMFPPPGWDESVRLATSAALASTMPKGQPREDSDARGVSSDPWLAAYERLARLVKLEGGGDPAEVARRLDAELAGRWRDLNGKVGPCGRALDPTGWDLR